MKQLLVFQPNHVLDIITNSSSELFVLRGATREAVDEMVRSIYSNYTQEYKEVRPTSELDEDELYNYINYFYNHYNNEGKIKIIDGFTFDEMYQQDGKWTYLNNDFICPENRDKIIKGIDPNSDKFFLFSLNENPDWNMQEQLENIGVRYHLG